MKATQADIFLHLLHTLFLAHVKNLGELIVDTFLEAR